MNTKIILKIKCFHDSSLKHDHENMKTLTFIFLQFLNESSANAGFRTVFVYSVPITKKNYPQFENW